MLKDARISSGDFPLIILATVAQQFLLQLDKVSIPFGDHVRHDLTLEGFLNLSHRLLQMMLAKLNDLVKDLRLDVGKRNLNRALVVVVVCV
jgi:hypothetical protein